MDDGTSEIAPDRLRGELTHRLRAARSSLGACLLAAAALAACRGGGHADAQPPSNEQAEPPGAPRPFQDVPSADLLRLNRPWSGDLDAEIAKHRFVRALVPHSRIFYYLDGAAQEGIAFESLREFEAALGKRFKGAVTPRVVMIPTHRDRLLPALAEGYGDIAIGGFTITDAGKRLVDFSVPTMTGIHDVLVTGPKAPPLRSLDDLAGQEVHVRFSSSYHDDLVDLSARLVKAGRPPVKIELADERLEDEDIMQMVDSGIFTITVVKTPYAKFWAQVYDRVTIREDLALRRDGETAWAIRKSAPVLREAVDEFVRGHRAGTLFGNTLLKRYLGNPERLRNPKADEELRRFRVASPLFQKYAGVYGFAWLALAAQAYQESGLDQKVHSNAGAIGVMQLLPATGREMDVGDIRVLENNVHAGVKYMRTIVDEHFKDQPMDGLDRELFAFASYNAGPARIAGLRKKARESGLDPNRWFGNVELIAAREIGHETVDYVSNIYKYYTVYSAVVARDTQGGPGKGAPPQRATRGR